MAEVHNVCIPLVQGGTLAVGTTYCIGFHVPTSAVGGGITITKCGVVSRDAIASGSEPYFTLAKFGTNSAYSASLGTVAKGAYTAGTIKDYTITTAFVDANSYVGFIVAGTAVNGDALFCNGYVQYVMGR